MAIVRFRPLEVAVSAVHLPLVSIHLAPAALLGLRRARRLRRGAALQLRAGAERPTEPCFMTVQFGGRPIHWR